MAIITAQLKHASLLAALATSAAVVLACVIPLLLAARITVMVGLMTQQQRNVDLADIVITLRRVDAVIQPGKEKAALQALFVVMTDVVTTKPLLYVL